MRLLFLYDNLAPNFRATSARLLIDVAELLAARGHDIVILTASNEPGAFRDLPGIRFRCIPERLKRWAHYRSVFSFSRAKEVMCVIDDVKPDIIHAHLLNWQLGFKWIPMAAARGIPCFYTFHSVIAVAYGKVTTGKNLLWHDILRARWTYNPFRNVLMRRYLSHARLLSVSDALRRFLTSHGFRQQITVLHNGIDPAFWNSPLSQADARSRLKLPVDVPLFLLAGRLGHDKGLHLLLDLWPRLTGDAHLVLAGKILSEVDTKKPYFRVLKDLGPSDMSTLYRAVDVNLVPSVCFDSLPTTSLESMACGTPVIVGNRGGGPEEVQDGVTGWVVDPGDPEAVQQRIQWCIDHRGELPAIGERAKAFVHEHFSLRKHIDQLIEIYKESLVL